MKKRIRNLILVLCAVLTLTNCDKYNKTFDAYFYSDVESAKTPLTLELDGEKKGELPNLKTSLSPDNDTIIKNALYLRLKSGKYNFEVKDVDGTVRCKGYLKFKTNSTKASVTMGGEATSLSGNVIVSRYTY
jgi:hypothetical protein